MIYKPPANATLRRLLASLKKKTFIYLGIAPLGHKSLLLLFFRKEDLPSFASGFP